MKCKSQYPIRIKERREVKSNYRSYFLDEFEIFDGESFVKFNLIDINHEKNEITVAVTHEGRISVSTYPLITRNGKLAFEYGPEETPVSISDFRKWRMKAYEADSRLSEQVLVLYLFHRE